MKELLDYPVAEAVVAVLAMGAAAYVLSRFSAAVGKALALAASAVVLVIGCLLRDDIPSPPVVFTLLPLAAGKTLDLSFAITCLGNAVVMLAAGFTVLISLYSTRFMAGRYGEGRYYAYVIWVLAGVCLVGWAGNFFVLLLGWELITLMLYLLLNLGERGCQEGAAKTFGILGFADSCLLMAVALMFAMNTRPFEPLYNLSLPGDAKPILLGAHGWMDYAVYVLLLIAALAKAGAMPLHSWIPAAAEGAPAPVMALLPGALDKLVGIYLLARVTLDVFRPDATVQVVLMCVGAVTILAAVFMAMVQHDLRRLLSFHAVSQVGYMVLGIGTGTALGVIGGLFHMVNHALYKSNLFLMGGAVGRAAGTYDIEEMGGLARRLPITFVCGAISAAAISGVPPFNGFVSKWLIYQGALELKSGLGTVMLAVAVFGSALTLASFVKVLYAAFLSRPPVNSPATGARENVWMAGPMVVLAAACVALGLFPQLVTRDVLVPAVSGAFPVEGPRAVAVSGGVFAVLTTPATGVWTPSLALGLVLVGMAGGVALLLVFAVRNMRVVRPFLAGEIAPGDDRFRARGTGFYETVRRMRVVGPLLAHGERGAMDLYHWAGRYGETLVRILRDQHAGLLHVYVAWCIVGLGVVLMYFLIAGVLP